MTTPAGGYPDFQAATQWKGANVSVPSTNYPVGTTELAFVDLTNWASLSLFMANSSGNILITIVFWADQAKTVKLDTYNIPAVSGTVTDLLIPAVGAYADISITTATVGGATVRWNFTPTNVPTTRLSLAGPPKTIKDYQFSLAASGSKNYGLFSIAPGEAYLIFSPNDATGKLQVSLTIFDENAATVGRLAFMAGPTVETSRIVILPAASVQLSVVNTDAGSAHTYDISLIANGG